MKSKPEKINIEIAPGNQRKMDAYIGDYNARPDRRTPKLKYTDVVNAALDRFLESNLGKLRAKVEGRKKK